MKYKFYRKSIYNKFNLFVIDLAVPSNISYMWNFGFLLGLTLVIQLVTGLFLTFHYAANVMVAFDSIIHIMRDVENGWLIRYVHVNGASFFFVFIYIHVSRGIFYFSFKKVLVWFSGIFLLMILMMIAFMGYILPWGQMSFWGATVITNLLSSLPIWGEDIVMWIWGGFSVDNATLNRFYSFHFFFPFFLILIVIFHLIFLHSYGSNNPAGLQSSYDKVSFYPYFYYKDFLGMIVFCFILFLIVSFNPILLMDSENFISANSLITPPHIQPEWYYLFSYAILRSIPSKLGGVLALMSSIIIFLILVFVKSKFSSIGFYPGLNLIYFLFIGVVLFLMWIGANQVDHPFYEMGQLSTFFFFFFFYMYYYVVFLWDKIFG